MLDRRELVLLARRALRRILAVRTMHLVEVLGLGVVGLEIVVADRPGWRDPVVVADLAEIGRPQPKQRRTVELRVATDVIVHFRREFVAVLIEPKFRSPVLAFHEHLGGFPVVPLPRQISAALQDQHLLPGRRESMSKGAPAGSGTDDDDVVVLCFDHLLS